MPSLASLTVAELDELAERHAIDDYPEDGVKADKVAALEDAGVEADPSTPVYRLRLKDGVGVASFMADTKAIELTDEDPVFETTDRSIYVGVRDLPFLEEDD